MAVRNVLIKAVDRVPKIVVVQMVEPYFILDVENEADYFKMDGKIDLFWSFGVLHHTPFISGILKRACSFLRQPEGECRICLYSDKGWERLMEEPTPTIPTHEHPRFQEYVRKKDPVGFYADWYNQKKIEQ